VRPDGDCIGSLLGIGFILDHFKVPYAIAAESLIYRGYRIIPGYEKIQSKPASDDKTDITIFADCGDRNRAFGDWEAPGKVINIDHHSSNDNYGDVNWVDPDCASVGEMIYTLLAHAEIEIDANCANALLTAIMTDTGCFRYSCVRAAHLEMCAELIKAGGDVTFVSKAAYESKSALSVKAEAETLRQIKYEADGALAWSQVSRSLLQEIGGAGNLPENLVNSIRSIEGVRVALLFIEAEEAALRMSLRGDGLIDLSEMAGKFGGGGHPNASGLTIKDGDFEALRGIVLAEAKNRVEQAMTTAS